MERISAGGYAALIGLVLESTAIAVGIAPVFAEAGEDGWLAMIFGLLGTLAILYPLVRLYARRSIRLHDGTHSRWTSALLVPVALVLFFFIVFNTRLCSDLLKLAYLPTTPASVITASYLLICGYAAFLGLEVLARVSLINITLKVLTFVVMPLFLYRELQLAFLEPLLGHGLLPVLRAAVHPFAWLSEGAVLVLLFGLVRESSYKTVAYGYLLGFFTYFVQSMLALLVLTAPLLSRFIYPALEVVQLLNIGEFMDRLDPVLVAIWTITMVIKSGCYLYLLSWICNLLLGTNIRQRLVFPFAFLALLFSQVLARNVGEYLLYYKALWPALIVCLYLNLFLIGWSLRLHDPQASGDARNDTSAERVG